MKNLILIILIIIITLSEALGQFLLNVKHHYTIKNISHFGIIPINILPILTWLLYGICTFLLMHSYKYTSMSKAEVYWDALSAVIVPLIGVLYFKSVINIYGWIGISLIIIGTLMLSFENQIKNFILERI